MSISFPLFSQNTNTRPKIKVAVVVGGHDYDKKAFDDLWRSSDLVSITTLDYGTGECKLFDNDPSQLYDVIVFYNMNQKLNPTQQQNFIRYLERGKSAIFVHHAISAFPEWEEFPKIIGAKYFLEDTTWEGKHHPRSKYKHNVKIPVHVVNPLDPITKDLTNFEVVDEVYSNYYISPNVKPLLTTTHPESAPYLAWINSYRNATVIYIQLGHGPEVFYSEQYRKLLTNAILWTSGLVCFPLSAPTPGPL